jgi:hydrogenase nickel incorporation protein HypA/HybF
MHELGLTQHLVEIAERAARENNARQVRSVTVEIGALAGVVPESVEFCFEACSRGTLLEGSRLEIIRIPGRGRCYDCENECDLDTYTVSCPDCGGFSLERLQGEELRVIEVEVD